MEKNKHRSLPKALAWGAAALFLLYFLLLLLGALLIHQGVIPQDKLRLYLCFCWIAAAFVGGQVTLAKTEEKPFYLPLAVSTGAVLLCWAIGMLLLDESSFLNGGIFFLAAALLGGGLALLPGRKRKGKRRHGKKRSGR